MRILRLDLDDGEELDLHPYLTVLGGLSPDAHRRVVERLVRLARGDGAGIGGLVEADQVLSEVSAEALAGLRLPADLDVVVRADQLPGAGSAPVVAAVAEVDAELAAASREVASLTAQLDEARREVDDFAVTAHDAAVATVEATEQRARARLAAAGGSADPLAAQRAELEEARRSAAERESELDAERLALLEMLEELEAATAELAELRPADATTEAPPAVVVPAPEVVAAVESAVAAVRQGPPEAPLVESPEAVELADRIAEHGRRHDALEQDLRSEGLDVVGLQEQLLQARTAAADAEVAARPKVISPEDDAEIERLHDIVVEQGERRGSRRGGKGAEAAYGEASEALDELLERVGYPTYAAYVMGRIAPAVDIDARRRLDELTVRVGELEGMLDQAESVLERDARVLMLRAERDQLWAAARDVLGLLPDDVEAALRRHRVPGEAGHPALEELRRLLDGLGVDRHGDTEPAVLGAAEAFLADAAFAAEARDRAEALSAPSADEPPAVVLERRVAGLHRRASEADVALAAREASQEAALARIADLEGALARAASELAGPEADTDAAIAHDPEVRAAREQLARTAARLERHRSAVARADQLLISLRAAREAERADRPGAAAAPAAPTADRDPDVVAGYLLDRAAALRQVCPSGSVPLILDDAFRHLPAEQVGTLAAALDGVAREVQIFYVGDHPAMASWALSRGLDVAAVVRPGQPAL